MMARATIFPPSLQRATLHIATSYFVISHTKEPKIARSTSSKCIAACRSAIFVSFELESWIILCYCGFAEGEKNTMLSSLFYRVSSAAYFRRRQLAFSAADSRKAEPLANEVAMLSSTSQWGGYVILIIYRVSSAAYLCRRQYKGRALSQWGAIGGNKSGSGVSWSIGWASHDS